MAYVFITGSADGLGMLAARDLVAKGHRVVLHARNPTRAQEALKNVPGAAGVTTGDLSDIDETRRLADEANGLGTFDAVIHNAGVYQTSAKVTFTVNTLAPFLLTSLMHRPKRLIYLTSGMHLQGRPRLEHFTPDANGITYSDTKLHVLTLAFAVARIWKGVNSNGVDPGWVPTKMGGSGAPDDLQKGYQTQGWLAVSDDAEATVSGVYFHHKKQRRNNPLASDPAVQDALLTACTKVTGVDFPL